MEYTFTYWADYDYSQLESIGQLKRRGKKSNEIYNDCIIMLDTETSRKSDRSGEANHIVAFTISIRAKHENIVTFWGHKPSECIKCIDLIMSSMNGNRTIIYVHNLAYDYVFLRKYLYEAHGKPTRQLNTKPHYPINIEFSTGLILKDSLILAQRSLDKWATDLDVSHKKAVGKWDYSKLRNQDSVLNFDELDYIEHDTLAGVECIDALMTNLHHFIYAMPYTATGIVRSETIKRGAKYGAHERFMKISPSFDVYKRLEKVFHGGYTHANRHYINTVLEGVKAFDFTSDYPFQMLVNKFPMGKFAKYKDSTMPELIKLSEDYAFITRLILIKPRLKNDDIGMPVLQSSKCDKTINAIVDNGRILAAELVDIYTDEQTLKIISQQYDFDGHCCIDCYYSRKSYLPKWFTDYVFELFKDKTTLKGKDLINYMIKKGMLNSTYGMAVQKAITDDIHEDYDTGEFICSTDYTEANYKKYLKNRNKVLCYQWGCWVTNYALASLYELGSMCEYWVYSDTDSCYGINWDLEKIEAYNMKCLERLQARGYDAVIYEGKSYILGSAALDGEYKEFKTLGAKRYCTRDLNGKLKITVAGVPKKGVECLKDDINNFQKGFIFDGKTTGKLQHTYIMVEAPYIDENGNETADSVDLSECDYLLDDITVLNWEELFKTEIAINVYTEQDFAYM